MNNNFKTLGIILTSLSLILLFVLTIVKIDFDNQSSFLCEKFHENRLDMNQCPAHKSNASWMFTIAYGISFLMLGAGLYLIFMFKQIPEETKKEFRQIDLTKLDEEEKKIYEIIKSKGGSAYQNDLIKETEFTKVKITRILDKLEMSNILERKRRGMTNLVVLK